MLRSSPLFSSPLSLARLLITGLLLLLRYLAGQAYGMLLLPIPVAVRCAAISLGQKPSDIVKICATVGVVALVVIAARDGRTSQESLRILRRRTRSSERFARSAMAWLATRFTSLLRHVLVQSVAFPSELPLGVCCT